MAVERSDRVDCFFLLVDWRELRVNIWIGLLTCLIQVVHDTEQFILNNYQIYGARVWIFNSPYLFTFGVVFTMGILFSQFLPRNKILKTVHILVFVLGFLAFEYMVAKFGMLKYIHFNLWISLVDDILVTITLAWVKSFFVSILSSRERRLGKC